MFAIRAWSVSASALKTQSGDAPPNRSGSFETLKDSVANDSQKRKHKDISKNAITGKDSEDISSLWRCHVERKRTDEDGEQKTASVTTPKKGKKRKASRKNESPGLARERGSDVSTVPSGRQTGSLTLPRKEESLLAGNDTISKSDLHQHSEITKQEALEPWATKPKLTSLQANMRQKLISSRFRHLNETLYTKPSTDSLELFTHSPQFFEEYHEGFRRQVEAWPENPLDGFLHWIQTRGAEIQPHQNSNRSLKPGKQTHKIADGAETAIYASNLYVEPLPRNSRTGTCTIVDLGCGEGQLARKLLNPPPKTPLAKRMKLEIRSYDLASTSQHVTVCDIRSLPLQDGSVDVAIFCLALMGTNWIEFIEEAYRVLRWKGECWISEVNSRFSTPKLPVMEQPTSRRKTKLLEGAKKKGSRHENQPLLTVDEDNPQPKHSTDVSAFVDVLRKRGFQLASEPELGNKMFARMRFVKSLPPSKGKGVLFKGESMRRKPAFIDDDSQTVISDETEASALKPCVYKTR